MFEDERPFAEPEIPLAGPSGETSRPDLAAFGFNEEEDRKKNDLTDEPEEEETEEDRPEPVIAEFIAKAIEENPQDDDESDEDDDDDLDDDLDESKLEEAGFTAVPRRRPSGITPWNPRKGEKHVEIGVKPTPVITVSKADVADSEAGDEGDSESGTPVLKLGVKDAGPQSELSLDSAPRGRFEGENPNVVDGEDLDLPPFLRKKKK